MLFPWGMNLNSIDGYDEDNISISTKKTCFCFKQKIDRFASERKLRSKVYKKSGCTFAREVVKEKV